MIYILTTFQGMRAKEAGADLFNPDPGKALSASGRQIVEAYDALVSP